MKILHFSDTHLGITLENTSREDDFYANFEKVIDDIISLKPDVVLHSGDLFHSPKPSNKAISIVVKSFSKLEKLGITFIIIAGNHDTPRLSLTTHPFEIFNSFSNFYAFYKNEINSVEIGKFNFVCLPHIHDENIFKEELSKTPNFIKKDKKNIFISHFGLQAREYDEYTDEISGVNISIDELKILKIFDYVALGHYHKNFCMGNICYAGSLEHTSFNQRNYNVGYNILDFAGEKFKKETVNLETRKMIDFGNIDCFNFDNTKDLLEFLEQKIDKNILVNAIIKIIFENISNKLMLEFDVKLINDFFLKTFYFEYKKIKQEKQKNKNSQIINSQNIIIDNFSNYINNYDFGDDIEKKESIKNDIVERLRTV